ncbi:MAG: type II secretion system protein [Patescibacteria group bacterium]
MIKHRESGSTLIEVVVVAAILSLVSLSFLGTFAALSSFHEKNQRAIKGLLLAEEGLEAVRLIKSGNWNDLAIIPPGSTRYLILSPLSWSITISPEIIDGIFYRSIRVFKVMRDINDDIVSSGGTIDLDTLRFESSVSWSVRNATATVSYEAYMTDI